MATKKQTDAVFALLPPGFRKCTDEHTVRYNLKVPFLDGGWVYCTDGRIVIRMRSTPAIDAAVRATRLGGNKYPDNLPVVQDLFDGPYTPHVFRVPDLSKAPACPDCNGSGVFPGVYCPDCDREIKAPGANSPCKACCETGYKDAWTNGAPLHRDGPWLSYRMLAILAGMNAELHPSTDKTESSPVWFCAPVCSGVEGVVMPLSVSKGKRSEASVSVD